MTSTCTSSLLKGMAAPLRNRKRPPRGSRSIPAYRRTISLSCAIHLHLSGLLDDGISNPSLSDRHQGDNLLKLHT